MNENRRIKDPILINEERIRSKLDGYLPPTIGIEGKMLRPHASVKYDYTEKRYDVLFYYQEE